MTRWLTLGLVWSTLVALPSAASGHSDDDEVRRSGSCSGSTDWQVRAKRDDDGRIEVRGRVDGTSRGQAWRWRIKHNGSVSSAGSAKTRGESASFEVRRTLVDLPGEDRIVFRAVRPRTREVCRAVIDW